MKFHQSILLFSLIWIQLLAGVHAAPGQLQYVQQTLTHDGNEYTVQLPKGYRLELLTDNLDGPRLMQFAANGDLLIGSKSGTIYRMSPPYGKAQAQALIRLDNYPHSLAIRGGQLLIARTNGLYQAPYRPGQNAIDEDALTLLAALPGGGGHNSRTVKIGPDGRIYVSLGISGNCSDEYLGEGYPFERRRGGILVLDEQVDPPVWRAYGSGLRNPVGFDWHPDSGAMYASNNGPDHHGYELPPEHFSRIDAGSFHGMPWFWFDGRKMQRDTCLRSAPPMNREQVKIPATTFPARSAPMDVAFIPRGAMDKAVQWDAVVAIHGSWGTKPSGSYLGDRATRRHPRLALVRFEQGKAIRVDDLVTGFQLEDGERWARPVGLAIGPDGALYFSSDGGIHGLFRVTTGTSR